MTELEQFKQIVIHKSSSAFNIAINSIKHKTTLCHEKMKLIYDEELHNNITVYIACAPLAPNVADFINYRIDHFDEYKNMATNYLQETFSPNFLTNYGIPSNYSLNRLSKLANEDMHETLNFTYDDNFRIELIKNTIKYQIANPINIITDKEQNMYTFYVGEHNGQNLLFVEKTAKTLSKQECGIYELGVYINGRSNGYMMLYSEHYNPDDAHICKLKNGKPNAYDDTKYTQNYTGMFNAYSAELCKNLDTTHRHVPTQLYGVLFPKSFSYDCEDILEDYKNYKDFIYKNKKQNNFAKSNLILCNANTDINVNDLYTKIKNLEVKQSNNSSINKEITM